jgi:hypothetical protein
VVGQLFYRLIMGGRGNCQRGAEDSVKTIDLWDVFPCQPATRQGATLGWFSVKCVAGAIGGSCAGAAKTRAGKLPFRVKERHRGRSLQIAAGRVSPRLLLSFMPLLPRACFPSCWLDCRVPAAAGLVPAAIAILLKFRGREYCTHQGQERFHPTEIKQYVSA